MKINDTLANYAGQLCFGATAIAFAPVSGGVTAAVGATALVAMFHAERNRKKGAEQLDCEKALKKITSKIADEWREDLPGFGKHEFQKQLHLAEEALKAALPKCRMDYTLLAETSTEGGGRFPDKATARVMEQLASVDKANFGEGGLDLHKKLARNVIRAAFMGAVENEDYFRKFEPKLLLAIAEKVGDIYDAQLALTDLSERNFEELKDGQARILEAIAAMREQFEQSGTIAKANDIGLNEPQITNILNSFGHENIPVELWEAKLLESATRLTQLQEELSRLTNDEPEIAALIDLAEKAIEAGEIEKADAHFAEAVRRDEDAGERRLRRAAENEGRRGDLAYAEARYIKAADHDARAARLIRSFDPLDWARLKYNEGVAAYERGRLDADPQNLQRAITAYREALKERTRERVPLDWAATQNNLGSALLALGGRGDDKALGDAITAYREALKERTRERIPLDWAETQNNLGNAFETLGDRDETIDHWVTSRNHSLAALEELTGRAPAYEAIARRYLASVEAKLKAAGWAPAEGSPGD